MRFYQLGANVHPSYYWAETRPDADEWKLLLRRSPPRNGPKYIIEFGSWPGDMIYNNVWSEKIIDVLKAEGATGFGSYPIKVIRLGNRIDGYRGVYVYGRGGAFDAKRSGAYETSTGLVYHNAVYMNESQWDGNDVFTISELGINIFLTERVAIPLMKLKLKNVSLRLNSECSFP